MQLYLRGERDKSTTHNRGSMDISEEIPPATNMAGVATTNGPAIPADRPQERSRLKLGAKRDTRPTSLLSYFGCYN